MGQKKANIEAAMDAIQQQLGPIIKQSSFYKTKAWGNEQQSDFYNIAILIKTRKDEVACLKTILKIEEQLGRKRQLKWEPRIIDIDILFYGNTIITTKRLTVPHPFLHERRFTLEPLNELSPRRVHPKFRKTISTLLKNCTDPLPVEKINS